MVMFHQHIILIFILVALHGKSFSHARPVKEVTAVTTKMVSASFSLPKEILPNAANFEESLRKMSNKKKASTSTAVVFVGKKNGGEGESFKAFSADYHSPKRHPPKNN